MCVSTPAEVRANFDPIKTIDASRNATAEQISQPDQKKTHLNPRLPSPRDRIALSGMDINYLGRVYGAGLRSSLHPTVEIRSWSNLIGREIQNVPTLISCSNTPDPTFLQAPDRKGHVNYHPTDSPREKPL